MRPSDTALVLETSQKIEAIRQQRDQEIREQYRSLVEIFQEIYECDAAEAKYLIFQADLRLNFEGLD